MKILCRIFDHDWRYDFPSVPSKRICARCKLKQKLGQDIEWTDAKFLFVSTDKDLIKRWHKDLK